MGNISVSLATEEEPDAGEFGTTRVSNRGASKQLKAVINGGLTASQVEFMWRKFHDGSAMDKKGVTGLVAALVEAYPTLFSESVDLGFQTYSRAPNPAANVAKLQNNLQGELKPVLAQMKKKHAQLRTSGQQKLAARLVARLNVPAAGYKLDEFCGIFQKDVGPQIAEQLLDGQFSESLLSSMAGKYYNSLRQD